MDNKNAGGRRVLQQYKWMNESGRKQRVSFTPLPLIEQSVDVAVSLRLCYQSWRFSFHWNMLVVLLRPPLIRELKAFQWKQNCMLSSLSFLQKDAHHHLFCHTFLAWEQEHVEASAQREAKQEKLYRQDISHYPWSLLTEGDIKEGDTILHLIWLLWQIVVPLKTVKVHTVIKSPFLLLSTWENHSLFQCFKD